MNMAEARKHPDIRNERFTSLILQSTVRLRQRKRPPGCRRSSRPIRQAVAGSAELARVSKCRTNGTPQKCRPITTNASLKRNSLAKAARRSSMRRLPPMIRSTRGSQQFRPAPQRVDPSPSTDVQPLRITRQTKLPQLPPPLSKSRYLPPLEVE